VALAQREQAGELGLHRADEVVDGHALRSQLRHLVHAQQLVVRAFGSPVAPVGEARELRDEQADREEEHRGADIFGLVDLERLVRAGEEEVERHRGDDRGDDTGHPSTGRGGQDHDDDEREGDVRGHNRVAPERHEDSSHHEGAEAGDREAESLEPLLAYVATLIVSSHDSVVPTRSD
jgi:hypothetical protein